MLHGLTPWDLKAFAAMHTSSQSNTADSLIYYNIPAYLGLLLSYFLLAKSSGQYLSQRAQTPLIPKAYQIFVNLYPGTTPPYQFYIIQSLNRGQKSHSNLNMESLIQLLPVTGALAK